MANYNLLKKLFPAIEQEGTVYNKAALDTLKRQRDKELEMAGQLASGTDSPLTQNMDLSGIDKSKLPATNDTGFQLVDGPQDKGFTLGDSGPISRPPVPYEPVQLPEVSDKSLPVLSSKSPSGDVIDISPTASKWQQLKNAAPYAAAAGAGTYLGLNSDNAQDAKVAKPGEQSIAPAAPQAPIAEPESNEEKTMKSIMAQLAVPSAEERVTIPKTSSVDFGQGQSNASIDKLKELQDRAKQLQSNNEIGRIGAAMAAGMGGNKNEYDQILQDRSKRIAQGPEDYLKQVAFEKEDPNSPVSQGYRQLAGAMGFEIKGNASAADLEKLYPQLSNIYTQREGQATRRDIARENREAKLQEMKLRYSGMQDLKQKQSDIKRFDDLNKKLISELASSRTTFGIDARTLQGTQNVRALIQGKDPNDLDNREVYEVAKVLDRILSQGNPTIAGSSKLTPDTARMHVSKWLEFLGNKRQGAGAGSFVNRFAKTLDREEEQATNRIVGTQGKLLASYADLKQRDPDKWGLLMQQHNLPDNILDKHVVNQQTIKQGGEAPAKADPKVVKFAQQYNMTYDDAVKLLQKRGYNAGQ